MIAYRDAREETPRQSTIAALTAAVALIVRLRPVLALRLHATARRYASSDAPRPVLPELEVLQ